VIATAPGRGMGMLPALKRSTRSTEGTGTVDRRNGSFDDEEDDAALVADGAALRPFAPFRPASAAVSVEFGSHSHPGRRRTSNDDHFLIVRFGRSHDVLATSLPDDALPREFAESAFGAIVADGIGPNAPDVASRLAVSALSQMVMRFGRWNVRVNDRTAWEIVERAERFYRRVSELVTQASMGHPSLAGMGTTLTAVYSGGDELFVVHVGHSRAYMLRAGVLSRLTRDQTVAQRMRETGRAVPTELAGHDLRHVLTDAIGGHAGEPRIDIENYPLLDGDLLLLCTNGLTDVVDDDAIADLLRRPAPAQDQCRALVNLALERGGPDNVTVVIAKYSIPPPQPDAAAGG
jgi:protein phosphatase